MVTNRITEDYHFDAKVGDLKLESILKIYAQISGAQPRTEEVKGHEFTFEELHLNIARKLKKQKTEEKKDDKKDKKDGEKKKDEKAIKEKGEEEAGDDKKEEDQEADKSGKIEEEKKVENEGKKSEVVKKDDAKEKKKEDDDEEAEWAFELSGKVSFNDVKSVHGLIKIDSTGLTIQGGLEDYKIEDIDLEIKEAKIDIFIGAKPDKGKNKDQKKIEAKPAEKEEKAVAKSTDSDKSTDVAKTDIDKNKVTSLNRASKFAIKGTVEFQKVPITVTFMMERKETNVKSKKTSEREWVLYGVYGGELSLSMICSELGESAIGKMKLKNIALIAASGENKTIKDLNVLKYPVKKGERETHQILSMPR